MSAACGCALRFRRSVMLPWLKSLLGPADLLGSRSRRSFHILVSVLKSAESPSVCCAVCSGSPAVERVVFGQYTNSTRLRIARPADSQMASYRSELKTLTDSSSGSPGLAVCSNLGVKSCTPKCRPSMLMVSGLAEPAGSSAQASPSVQAVVIADSFCKLIRPLRLFSC